MDSSTELLWSALWLREVESVGWEDEELELNVGIELDVEELEAVEEAGALEKVSELDIPSEPV